MILPSCSPPFVPRLVGRGDQVQVRVDEVLDLISNKRLSVNGHDVTARARGELHAEGVLDEPVVPVEALAPEVKRRATSYEQRATSY